MSHDRPTEHHPEPDWKEPRDKQWEEVGELEFDKWFAHICQESIQHSPGNNFVAVLRQCRQRLEDTYFYQWQKEFIADWKKNVDRSIEESHDGDKP